MLSEKRIKRHVDTTLRTLKEKGPLTCKEAGFGPVEALRLEAAPYKLIKRAGVRQTGTQGRPAIEWRVTDKARKRVNRAANSTR